MNYFPIVLLLIGGVILTVGDVIGKQWAKSDKLPLFFLALVIYMAAESLLVISFKFKNIAVASLTLTLFNVIVLAFVSTYYFKEKLTTGETIGVIIGLLSVIIMTLGKK